MMRTILCVTLAIFVFFSHSSAQSLDSALAKIARSYQPEKVYLQYDKSSYYAGETIWFKAYLMQGIYPATDSKTLYVDWIGDKGEVLSHTVSPVVDAATNGQFDVPTEYSGSAIHVRAYTKWMLNFDTAFLYSKDISILPKEPVKTKTVITSIPSLQFFPEGGDIILGVPNRIAFKANDQYGRPVKIKGSLLDDKGTVLTSFSSVHDGMGSFSFAPLEDRSYSVKWTDEKNAEHKASLPPIRSSGVSLQVAVENDKKIVTVNAGKQLETSLHQLHLVGTINQNLVLKSDISLNQNNAVKRIIPTQNFPTGILILTLFDANWNAIAERITFINSNDYSFQPQMEVIRWGLGKRKRNEVEIRLPDSLQGTTLSVSVTDAAIERDTTDNIISHLLLSSEIKGKVYNAAYYFSNNSDSVAQHLDLVMLTNGWRRFKWENVVKGKLPAVNYAKDTSYLVLSGKLFGVARNQLTGKESIALLVKEKKDSVSRMMIMNIRPDGSFSDPDIVLFDTLRVYYSLKSKFLKEAEARFMTDRLPAPNYTEFSKNFTNANSVPDTTGMYHHTELASKALEILKINRGEIMKTVVVQTTKKPPVKILDEKYTSGMFKGEDAYQFDLVNDPAASAYMDIFNYLQGKVAGLQINTTTQPPTLSWRGGSPIVFLDEVQTDADMLAGVPVNDIAYIKVFRPPFMGGFGGSGGAIAVYTRRGNDQTSGKGGLASNTVSGYTPIRQFYSPNYDSFDPRNDHLDIRTTLYWNPLLVTNQKSKSARLIFYNNDVTKAFRVVVEGMTRDGLLTHFEQIIE